LNREVETLLIDPKNILIVVGTNFSGDGINQALVTDKKILPVNNLLLRIVLLGLQQINMVMEI
jgi:hypothetical protein